MTNKEFISICIDAVLTVVFFAALYIAICAYGPLILVIQEAA